MKILGVDPGSQITGFGIIQSQGSRIIHIDNGGIFTKSQDSFPQKLSTLFLGVTELVEKYKPDVVAIENIFYAKNIRSSFQLGHARGALIVALANQGLPIFEYTPLTVKQALVGYGRASKEQIQQMVKHLLRLPETTYFDASDALAVAICHSHSIGLENKIRKVSS